jgi:hypothetical protein
MGWRCPACRTEVAHRSYEDLPKLNIVYQCYVCRLELRFNQSTGHLEPVPLSDPGPQQTVNT